MAKGADFDVEILFYIRQIPGGMTIATASSSTGSLIIPTTGRACGRFFNPATAQTTNVSICSTIEAFAPEKILLTRKMIFSVVQLKSGLHDASRKTFNLGHTTQFR
jgi:hypothetical protein